MPSTENTPPGGQRIRNRSKKSKQSQRKFARQVLASLDNLENANCNNLPDFADLKAKTEKSTVEKQKRVFKILVVGNSKCGKTSIIQRYANDVFNSDYNITIGADYTKKVVDWYDGTSCRLQLWDIAGQDRFANLTRPYYRNACAAVVVCDVTRQLTLEAVRAWKQEIDDKLDGIPCVLLANKCDMLKGVSEAIETGARIENMCSENKFSKWFICSAKKDENINDAMDFLLQNLMNTASTVKPDLGVPQKPTGILLGNPGQSDTPFQKSGCC